MWGEGAQLELNLGIYGLEAQDLERLEQRITVGHGYKDRTGLDINRRIIKEQRDHLQGSSTKDETSVYMRDTLSSSIWDAVYMRGTLSSSIWDAVI